MLKMNGRIRKFRRDRWRDQVITVGKQLRKLEASRAGINAHYWPEDAGYLDFQIDQLTRRRDGLLNRLKETA